ALETRGSRPGIARLTAPANGRTWKSALPTGQGAGEGGLPRPPTDLAFPMTFTGTAPRADLRNVLVVSDIHYASDAEKARGPTEARAIENPLLRALVKAFRHFIWMRNPYAHNSLLDQFLAHPGPAD